mgnify:CR=1 FL=1
MAQTVPQLIVGKEALDKFNALIKAKLNEKAATAATNIFSKPQKIIGIDTDGDTSGQPALLKVLSTEESTSSGATWQGRMMVGAKNKTFLMGTYHGMCGLGAHSWTDSAAGTGAAWEGILRPD